MSASVLVIGSGGREHALAWKLSQSPQVGRIIVAPGNAGMPAQWERWSEKDYTHLAERASREGVSLVVVGPDQDLANGITDVFEAHGVSVFGPGQKAAQIEASKGFAKEIMKAAGVPTAAHWWVRSEEEGRQILKSIPWGQWVVKADGLALGKGVRICATLQEGLQAVKDLIQISGTLVIEEMLKGEEISWMAFCDGETCSLLEPARDYKRLGDRDQGPNTGGMGAISPVPNVPASWYKKVREEVFLPTLKEMKARGIPFKGLLYAGLMVDFSQEKFSVLEFNSRFGDPETQVLVARMDGDLFSWCLAVARGALRSLPEVVPFIPEHAVVVVAVSQGYPEQPQLGRPIHGASLGSGFEEAPYFFAGVRQEKDQLLTSGGRVLGALGQGASLEQARGNAYQALGRIEFEGKRFREDIGQA